MLPEGRHPFERIGAHLDVVLQRSGQNARRVIRDRQETILAHGPSEMHVGLGGFENYIAYVFADRGLVVLECIRHGNAIYVFGQGWKAIAQLSKAEIIDGGPARGPRRPLEGVEEAARPTLEPEEERLRRT